MSRTDRPEADALAALEALHAGRFSCRAFRPDPVPREVITRLLEVAQRTATWCNTQPWQLWITEGEGTERLRRSLYAFARGGGQQASDFPWPREYRGVYLERRRETGKLLLQSVGVARDDIAGRDLQSQENFRFFGAPHLAIVTTDEALGTYGAVDCGAYVANFLLAARACGVDTCAQAAIARYSGFLREHLSLPEDRRVVCAIAFGYADGEHPANAFRVGRAGLQDVVHWVDA